MSITHLTFVDIETVSQVDSDETIRIYTKRFRTQIIKELVNEFPSEDLPDEVEIRDRATYHYKENAALYAEFGKVVCISIGKMVIEEDKTEKFYIRTIAGRNEAVILEQASKSLAKANGTFVAHNGIEFDFPFLMRRYMINGLPIPPQLDVAEVKPWDVKLRDTMKMWSGTAWNYKISLDLLCHVLGVPSPKNGIDGSDVAKIYYDYFNVGKDELPFEKETEALKKIGDYCSGDVLAVANCYCKMKGIKLIENVEYV